MARSRSSSRSSSDSSNSSRHSKLDKVKDKAKDKAAEVLGIAKSFVDSRQHSSHEIAEAPSGSGHDASDSHPTTFHVDRPWHNGLKPAALDPDISKPRAIIWTILTVLLAVALIIVLGFPDLVARAFYPWIGILPNDPFLAAMAVLDKAPVIDGHIDLPYFVRYQYANNVTAIDLNSDDFPGHVDIPRLRKGKVGGFFWSVYVGCPDPNQEGPDFVNATWRVRDTLEQIDVSKGLIAKFHDTFEAVYTPEGLVEAVKRGKIASILGVEGGHQLGNSLAVARQYFELGVRYVTLTHICHNAFADSCGYLPGKEPLHGGLSDFGYKLIDEMNRLGMLVDLSHTSDDTAKQALEYSKAPVIWSHSSARAVHYHPRNVPDDILSLVGTSEGKKDGVIMVNFSPDFVADEGEADLKAVADHVEHIASLAGKDSVGIGSDFDGIVRVPEGLEDVTKYPDLFAELYSRGWDKYDLAGLAGGNLIRVWKKAEHIAGQLRANGAQPAYDLYDKRPDLPARKIDEL